MQHRLPEDLVAALRAAAPSVRSRWNAPRLVEPLVQLLDTLPPAAVVRADSEVAWSLDLLFCYPEASGWWRPRSSPRTSDLALLWRNPGLAHLFVFHRDGHLREAALNAMHDGARSPFFFAVIAMRLNDWAAPVRRAAVRCAERVFPITSPEVVAAAAIFLLDQRQRWLRWGPVETGALDRALQRADVADRLVNIFCNARQGPIGSLLRSALRGPEYDHWLAILATDAILPEVRKVALQALIEREVRWPSHRERQWIDKSMGRYRERWALASRTIDCTISVEDAVAIAANDRSAAVRRIAVIALLTRHRTLANFDAIAAILSQDNRPALRERTAFALNMPSGSSVTA